MQYHIEPPSRATGRQILTAAQMRAADADAISRLGVPGVALMENAGRHVARVAASLCSPGARIGIVIGAGNNGGDGSVAARHLLGWGFSPTLCLATPFDRPVGDARIMLDAARATGVPILDLAHCGDGFDLIIDALLGTGLTGVVRGAAADAIAWMNRSSVPVLAVDIASGLCADTGRPLGAAVRATHTVTFVASAPGHWLHPGPDFTGALHIVDIGMPAAAVHGGMRILDAADLAPAFAPRDANTHKGRQGDLLVWAGSPGRTGAARLTLSAAQSAGAGLTTLVSEPATLSTLAPTLWESMGLALPDPPLDWLIDQASRRSALVIGPGMSTSPATGDLLRALLARTDRPVVLDADGLNHCVGHLDDLGAAVLTPHPGEAARLLDCTPVDVQADRLGAARALAQRSKSVTVLKGAHTLVALPNGAVGVCPAGNPGMATAGMGDVLAGIIGALLARGLDAASAAAAGVLWHAHAGDRVAADRGQAALRARDVIAALGRIELEDGPWPI